MNSFYINLIGKQSNERADGKETKATQHKKTIKNTIYKEGRASSTG